MRRCATSAKARKIYVTFMGCAARSVSSVTFSGNSWSTSTASLSTASELQPNTELSRAADGQQRSPRQSHAVAERKEVCSAFLDALIEDVPLLVLPVDSFPNSLLPPLVLFCSCFDTSGARFDDVSLLVLVESGGFLVRFYSCTFR